MFDSPNWISSAISAKLHERASNYSANVNAANQLAIAQAQIAANKAIAKANRESAEAIAQANRESTETIAQARIESEEKIAGERRTVDKEIAQMRIASDVASNAVRTLPFIPFAAIGTTKSTVNDDSSDKGGKTPPKSGGTSTIVVKSAEEVRREKAREKAEKLFPNLDEQEVSSTSLQPLDIKTSNWINNVTDARKTIRNMMGASGITAAILTGTKLITMVPFI